MAERDDVYEAIVEKVVVEGRHGPYAVARSGELVFTFSLKTPTWSEEDLPEEGTFVVLSRVTKKRAGWRANRARFLKPSDRQ
ncbi:MAG: hypothetical protein QF745_11140 [Planctomycetota bacterium]|jgi:hypothetical protein|nr:hypothetical protein [Parcubacteria group bacterium]MDP7561080.1 hypothetical protein [Planctomycetota bacterium]|tara:strand:- start:262 stop:507 length:246 start_codon:yes stop_codon:yes gene_type:complete